LAVSFQKKFSLPTERIDFNYVSENWFKTHPYYSHWGSNPEPQVADLRVYCAKCNEELQFSYAFDRPQQKFICRASRDAWGNITRGCDGSWDQAQIDKMLPKAIGELFYTVPHVTDETIYVIDEKSDGLKRFSYTRVATFDERANFYKKYLKERRLKIGKEKK
jgi:hypothetical protein